MTKQDDEIVAEFDAALAKEIEKKDDEAAQKAADSIEQTMKVTPAAPNPKPKRGEDGFVREAGPDSAQE